MAWIMGAAVGRRHASRGHRFDFQQRCREHRLGLFAGLGLGSGGVGRAAAGCLKSSFNRRRVGRLSCGYIHTDNLLTYRAAEAAAEPRHGAGTRRGATWGVHAEPHNGAEPHSPAHVRAVVRGRSGASERRLARPRQPQPSPAQAFSSHPVNCQLPAIQARRMTNMPTPTPRHLLDPGLGVALPFAAPCYRYVPEARPQMRSAA